MSGPDGHRCPTCLLIGMLRRTGAVDSLRRLAFAAVRSAPPAVGRTVHPATRGFARAVHAVLRPCRRHHALEKFLAPAIDVPLHGTLIDHARSSRETPSPGINLVGYLTADSGLGEAARLMSSAVQASELPHALIDFNDGSPHTRTDTTLGGFARSNPHDHNLVHVNGDQFPVFVRTAGRRFFEGRRNIGYWHWEQRGVPVTWSYAFKWLDEIWAPTRFVVEAIRANTPVPVRRVPLPVRAWSGPLFGREHFQLPNDRFVFLFLFDYHSVFERKNPLAAVEAFQRAFADTDRALLVVKSSHSEVDPENAALLARAIRHPSVRLIDASLTRAEVASLIAASDAFVSLHRSEGFGLGLAEAMLAGKPVIATDWSGNTDFMTADNSYPVRYELATLERDVGPYRKGNQWAEPDVEHAAEWMRHVFEQPDDVAIRVARAQRDLALGFSPAAVAEQLRAIVGDHRAGRTLTAELSSSG